MNSGMNKPTTMFWLVAVVALLWNLAGVAMFCIQMTLTPEIIAAMPPEQQQIHAATPGWLNIFFAIGVFAGALGSVGLLMRRRWATSLFGASLLAVVIQMVGAYLLTPAWQLLGAGSLVMPVLVIAIALYLWRYAANATAKGWLR